MAEVSRSASPSAATLLTAALLATTASMCLVRSTSGQITTGCTSAFVSTFTPCMNYITGSSNGGGGVSSPSSDCCKSVGNLLSGSIECGCLLLTGNVPFSFTFNRTLALSLPSICKAKPIPLFQCKGSAAPLPSPGPVYYGPTLPPLPPQAPLAPTPPSSTVLPPFGHGRAPAPAATGKLKPVLLLPSAAAKLSTIFVSIPLIVASISVVCLLE